MSLTPLQNAAITIENVLLELPSDKSSQICRIAKELLHKGKLSELEWETINSVIDFELRFYKSDRVTLPGVWMEANKYGLTKNTRHLEDHLVWYKIARCQWLGEIITGKLIYEIDGQLM